MKTNKALPALLISSDEMRMNKYALKILIIPVLMINFAFSQETHISQYILNKTLVSPAFTGFNNNSELFAGYLRSWIGISGAPTVSFVNFNTPLYDKYGVGINISDSHEGNFNKFKAELSGTIKIKLNLKSNLYFGLSANVLHTYYDFSNAKSQGVDPVFVNLNSLKTNIFDADAGVLYSRRKFNAGLASKSILQNDSKFIGSQAIYSRSRVYITHFSYFFDVNDEIYLEPFLFLSYNKNFDKMPVNVEASLLFSYKNNLHFSMAYRRNNFISFGFGGAVSDNLVINYIFETSFGGVAGISSGTHEISLGIMISRHSGFSRHDIFPVTRSQVIAENNEIEISNIKKDVENVKNHFNKIISAQNNKIDNVVDNKNTESNLKNLKKENWKDSCIYENIKFAVNTDLLMSISEAELRAIVVEMFKNPSMIIKINSNVRNAGSIIFLNNRKQKRSEAIKKILVEKGVDEKRILIGWGETDDNESVEILFSQKINNND